MSFSSVLGLRLVRRDGLVGADLGDGDQRQAEVADFLEQAMQRGLVGHRAGDERACRRFVGEAQSVEPGGPAGAEVTLNADLVRSGLEIAGGLSLMVLLPLES